MTQHYNTNRNTRFLERRILMTAQEKLIQFIHNLTDEEADIIVSFLKESASSEEASPHLPLYTVPQEQEVAV